MRDPNNNVGSNNFETSFVWVSAIRVYRHIRDVGMVMSLTSIKVIDNEYIHEAIIIHQ